MASGKKRGKGAKAGRVSERKVPRTYRLNAKRIAEARRILGAPSDTAAIEMALDMVAFRAELVGGVRALRGLHVEPFEQD